MPLHSSAMPLKYQMLSREVIFLDSSSQLSMATKSFLSSMLSQLKRIFIHYCGKPNESGLEDYTPGNTEHMDLPNPIKLRPFTHKLIENRAQVIIANIATRSSVLQREVNHQELMSNVREQINCHGRV
jgi:hypothetical protein